MSENKQSNVKFQERIVLHTTNASTAATATEKLWTVPPGRKFRIDRVIYNNPTGLVADAANFFTITVKNLTGPKTPASWSTQTGTQGALTADTPVTLVNSATDSDMVFAAGDVVQASFVKSGTQTLPAGRLVIEGRLL